MRNTLHVIAFVLLCMMTHTFASAQTTLRLKPLTSSDDAEQNTTTGAMQLNSSDLELGGYDWDARFKQTTGIRFPNVTLPQGATITKAYIQFSVDELYAGGNSANMTIKAQKGNAATYAATANNISSRTYTTANVNWVNSAWTVLDQRLAAQQTPDLKAMVIEVLQTGFVSGNALAFCFTTTTNGYATTYSVDRGAANAPELVIEYTTLAPLSIAADKASGTYTTPFSVVLTGTSGSTIRYTTNGTTPTATTGTVYSAPIAVNATTTLKAIAVSTNNASTVLSLNYVFAACGSTTNLALNKPTQQSSTYLGGESARAVDGNTSGIWNNNSVTHTNNNPNTWWQVDLGQMTNIDAVKLFNRTDCCGERLTNFHVMVSDAPFTADDLATNLAQASIKSYYFQGTSGAQTTIPFNTRGRYVRIQLVSNALPLSLAEVQVTGCAVVIPRTALSNIFINEVAASGSATNKFDWIELHNANTTDINLDSVFLSDNALLPFKYQFKNGFLSKNGFATVSADGDLLVSTNDFAAFGISATKPNTIYLTQVFNGVTTRLDSLNTVPMVFNTSYGRQPDGSNTVKLFSNPTPSVSNNNSKQLVDLTFSQQRGLYSAPFSLTITAPAGLTIRYTTNNTTPSATNGTVYTTPINIAANTVIKAYAYSNVSESKVVTQTYILISSTVNALPSTDKQLLTNGLKELPIVCLTTTENIKTEVEKPCTFEYIDKFGTTGKSTFLDAGFNVFQWSSLSTVDFGQNSIRVKFKSQYGYKKLEHKVFDRTAEENYDPVSQFDALDLRVGMDVGTQKFSQFWADANLGGTYTSENFMHGLMRRLGSKDVHVRYAHTFVNGKYHGVVNLRERFNSNYMESYFGGTDVLYDRISYVNAGVGEWGARTTEEGTDAQWVQSIPSFRTNFQEMKKRVDINHLINFMLVFYVGDFEWEARACADKGFKNSKFILYHNDSDGFARGLPTGFSPYTDRLNTTNSGGPEDIFALTGVSGKTPNLEFQTLVKDKTLTAFTENSTPFGVLSVNGMTKAITELGNEYRKVRQLEIDRWTNFHTVASWESRMTDYINYLPTRVKTVKDFLASKNLLHTLSPLSINKPAGKISVSEQVIITNPNAGTTVYYTLDGQDVVFDNAVATWAKTYTTGQALPLKEGKNVVKARAYTNGNFGPLTDVTYIVAPSLNITGVNYFPKAASAKASDSLEFLLVTNYGTAVRAVGGDSITAAISFAFPAGTVLNAGETVMIAKFPAKYPAVSVRKFSWIDGKLADAGEKVVYKTAAGEIINEFTYLPTAPWATTPAGQGDYLKLNTPSLDNAVATNWQAATIASVSTIPVVALAGSKMDIFAQKQGSKAIISWTSNHKGADNLFEIEKFNDQTGEFEVLKSYRGSENQTGYLQYTDEDPSVISDNLYRIAFYQGQNKTPQYSDVVRLDFSYMLNYSVYPNPANDYVNIEIHKTQVDNATLRIVNIYGQTVLEQVVSTKNGIVQLSTETLGAGQYILFMEIKGKRSVAKKLNIVR